MRGAATTADTPCATRPTHDTAATLRSDRCGLQSRRTSPRSLREVRRRFSENLVINLERSHFTAQPRELRLYFAYRLTLARFAVYLGPRFRIHPVANARRRHVQAPCRFGDPDFIRKLDRLALELRRV